MRAWLPVAALLLLVLGACAERGTPGGGEPDRVPPRIISVTPEPFSVVPGYADPVVIRFDERISERDIGQAVSVSPETGEVRVSKGRSELRISVKGGWQPNQIYRIVLNPVLRDLFGNQMQETVDLVFSTGPPIPNTALAGLVLDRLTDNPVADARVEATRRLDSATYVAFTDTAGLFALRHIPAGAYDIRAYQDRVRNRRPDFSEPIDTGFVVLGVSDTTLVMFNLLAPDTTPARVVGAEAVETRAVRVILDDHVDPMEALTGVSARIWRMPDSVEVEVASVVHANVFAETEAERKAAERAAADTLGGDTVVVDTAAVPQDTSVVAGDTTVAETETALLPSREIVVIPASVFDAETRYVVEVTGVRNLSGLEGGGGSATFSTPRAPDPEPEPEDGDEEEPASTGETVPPDTIPPPEPRGERWRRR